MKKLLILLCCFTFMFTACAEPRQEKLRIGYIPFLPFSQLFIIDGEGWADDLDIEFVRFNGSGILHALQSGDLDGAAIATVPLMVAKSNGVDIQAIAGLSHNFSHLVGRGAFAQDYQGDFASALNAFYAREQRPLKVFVNFKGSVQDLVARYWLKQNPQIDQNKLTINNANPDQMQQALATGDADVALIPEPLITVVKRKDNTLRTIIPANDLFSGFPGGVIALNRNVIENDPELVQRLSDLTVTATDLIYNDPKRAAKSIHKIMARGLLDLELFEKATLSAQDTFTADLGLQKEPSRILHDYMLEIEQIKTPINLDSFFNTSFYRKTINDQD